MRTDKILALPGLILAVLLATMSVAVAAEEASTTSAVNMRAGPGTSYRALTVIPQDAYVLVHGCVAGYRWCDTSWRDERGWVYSAHLASLYGSRHLPLSTYGQSRGLPIILFRSEDYGSRHYGSGRWYYDRGLYNPLYRYRDHYGSSYYQQQR